MFCKVLKGTRCKEDNPFEIAVRDEFLPRVEDEKKACESLTLEEEKEEAGKLMEETRQKAAQTIKSAQEEKEKILKEARDQAKRLQVEAREKGYREGLEKGQTEGQRMREKAEDFLKEVEGLRRQIINDLEPEAVRLSVQIAEKLVCQQLSLNRETIVGIVSASLKKLSEQDYILVRATPREAEILKNNRESLRIYLKDRAQLDILADGEITPGSCRVESDHGMVEVNLEEDLKEIKSVLEEVLEEGEDSSHQLE